MCFGARTLRLTNVLLNNKLSLIFTSIVQLYVLYFLTIRFYFPYNRITFGRTVTKLPPDATNTIAVS